MKILCIKITDYKDMWDEAGEENWKVIRAFSSPQTHKQDSPHLHYSWSWEHIHSSINMIIESECKYFYTLVYSTVADISNWYNTRRTTAPTCSSRVLKWSKLTDYHKDKVTHQTKIQLLYSSSRFPSEWRDFLQLFSRVLGSFQMGCILSVLHISWKCNVATSLSSN